MYILKILSYLLKRNEHAYWRTLLFSNFLFIRQPRAASLPLQPGFLFFFSPPFPPRCSACVCLWNERDKVTHLCRKVLRIDSYLYLWLSAGLCAQRRLTGCWWTWTGSWHVPGLWLREMSGGSGVRSGLMAHPFTRLIECLLSASSDLFYSLFLPLQFFHSSTFCCSLHPPSLPPSLPSSS